jgi:hypothetical protein
MRWLGWHWLGWRWLGWRWLGWHRLEGHRLWCLREREAEELTLPDGSLRGYGCRTIHAGRDWAGTRGLALKA